LASSLKEIDKNIDKATLDLEIARLSKEIESISNIRLKVSNYRSTFIWLGVLDLFAILFLIFWIYTSHIVLACPGLCFLLIMGLSILILLRARRNALRKRAPYDRVITERQNELRKYEAISNGK
jgi:ABC-type bacteriocin/lantibiotic exporter with double-glycine peptidase domain